MDNVENRSSVLQEYYSRYLLYVRKTSQSSVDKYVNALKKISQHLKDRRLITQTIYEVMDISELEMLREILYSDQSFIEYDKRGHRMYSAALNNYCSFASGKEPAFSKQSIAQMDIPIEAEPPIVVPQKVWKRSHILRIQSISAADYKCEIDSSHSSFIAESTNQPYMEAHHAIPMTQQEHFNLSLDVYANIICLCPTCHRKIHYGLQNERTNMVKRIYYDRSERLANSGIKLSCDEFVSFAVNR